MNQNKPLIFFESFILAAIVAIPILSLLGTGPFLGFFEVSLIVLLYTAGFSPILFIWALITIIPLQKKIQMYKHLYLIYMIIGAIPGIIWTFVGPAEVNDTVKTVRITMIVYGAILFTLLHFFLKKRGYNKSLNQDAT